MPGETGAILLAAFEKCCTPSGVSAGARIPRSQAGRLFGTALMIVCPHEPNGEGDLSTPMEAEDYQEDGIANLWVVDRWACSVQNWQTNPFIPSTVPFTSTG